MTLGVKTNMKWYCLQQLHLSTILSWQLFSSQREICQTCSTSGSCRPLFLIGRQGLEMIIPVNWYTPTTPTTPTQSRSESQDGSEVKKKHSFKTTTPVGRGWYCKNRPGGAKEKPPKTTSSTWREHLCQCQHGQLTWGTIYPAAKTIRQASMTGDRSLRDNRLFHLQAQATGRWPSKTIILEPEEPAFKPCESRRSFSMEGRLRESSDE